MQNDKRKNEPAIPENLRQVLTPAQAKTLEELKVLGWQLKYVRRPMFLEPVPVVANARHDQIGVLDPDGRINIDTECRIRAEGPQTGTGANSAPTWTEKRKNLAPVPDNLERLLNVQQIRSLHQIENFGWQLHFVRRPMFQDPVVVIVSAEGDRFGTLEADGRIEIRSQFDLRDESLGKQGTATPGPVAGK